MNNVDKEEGKGRGKNRYREKENKMNKFTNGLFLAYQLTRKRIRKN